MIAPALFSAVAVLVSAIVKGAIGFGFPTLSTPLLALVIDVKVAVAVLILPNIVMDSVQVARRGGVVDTARRLWVVIVFGMIGTVIGTWLLVLMPARLVTLTLGVFVVLFVVLNATPFSPRVPAHWERWLSAPAGLIAGIVGGVTNVPGTALVVYFYALGMEKHEFVRSIALSFVIYKIVQLATLAWYGIMTWRLVPATLGLTVAALAGFAMGLRIQDRLDQAMFNRAVLVFLAALGIWLTIRAVT